MKRKAKRGVERMLTADEAATHMHDQVKQAEAHRQALNTGVVTTFDKRAREAAIAL